MRSFNTEHFHSYSSSKNVLFIGQSDLDPQTIDLNLDVILPIEILYQYVYVAEIERLNFGTVTACFRKGSAYQKEVASQKGTLHFRTPGSVPMCCNLFML